MYWERAQEITLLHLVLEPLDPDEDRFIADEIVSGLIEMDLVDMDKAPRAQQVWQDEWEGGRDVTREFIARHYEGPDADGYED